MIEPRYIFNCDILACFEKITTSSESIPKGWGKLWIRSEDDICVKIICEKHLNFHFE